MNMQIAMRSIEDFYRRIYWESPTATTHATPQYTISYSGITWMHSVNHLWMHNGTPFDPRLLAATGEFFQHFHAEYSVVFADRNPIGASELLSELRFSERANSPIYMLHGLPRPRFANREARIERVRVEQQSVLLSVLYGTFFIGAEAAHCVVRLEHFQDPTIRHYLAYIDNDPAGCATILLHEGIAGVWNVGTLRPYRRRGLASAILMRALADAASDGYPDSVLMASPMGRSLYEEMGYELVGYTHHFGPNDGF
jgi:GNAT superfamily N-acetyltransferase